MPPLLTSVCPDILELSHGWRKREKCPRLLGELAWIDRLTEELDWALSSERPAAQALLVETALAGMVTKMPNAAHVSDAARRARDALPGASRESVMVERLRGPHASQPAETDAEVVSLYHGYKKGFLNCVFSSKVRALCEVCGVRYRVIDVDLEDKPAWFAGISPKKEVPVAYVKGELLQDSSVITNAVKSLVTDDGLGRPDACEFLRRESALSDEAVGGVLGSFFGFFVCPPGSDGEAAAREKWEALMREYEAVLGSSDYLCGSSMGPVDVLEFPLLRLCPDILELSHGWRKREKCPRLLVWIDRLTEELDWALSGDAAQALLVENKLCHLLKVMPNAAHVSDAARRARDALPGASRESMMVERLRGPHASQPSHNDSMIMTLYHGFSGGRLLCRYSLKVRWLAEELGVQYRLVDIDLEDKPDWFQTISPKLQCPVAYIQGNVLTDSSDIIASLLELAGKGDVKHPEFVLRESKCSIDADSAHRADLEVGAFAKFVTTPPDSLEFSKAQYEWENSVRLFEQCLSNSGKPFLCGECPGRLDAEVVFWRTALPLVELAVGWTSAEFAPSMTNWVKRMESLDSMKRATDGAATVETLVVKQLNRLVEQFPVPHLKDAAKRARELVVDADGEQALINKVQSFCDTVLISDRGDKTIVLQFVQSAFMEHVQKTQPRRHYTVEEWRDDVLASVEHKKIILQSMVASVVFKVNSLGATTNPITPWLRAAQDGCVLALVELPGDSDLGAKLFLNTIDANRKKFLQLGLIGAAIPGESMCVVLGLDEEPGESITDSSVAIFPEAVVFEAAPAMSKSDTDDERAAGENEGTPLSAIGKVHHRTKPVHTKPVRLSSLVSAQPIPSLAEFCAQPSVGGTTKQRNPAMGTRRSQRQTQAKLQETIHTPVGGNGDGIGDQRDATVNRQASPRVAGAWKRASNGVNASTAFNDKARTKKRAAKEKAVMNVASSRQMKRWHPKNWYFLLLEVGWGQLIAIFCAIYGAVWYALIGNNRQFEC